MFDAPRERVWRAFTPPSRLVQTFEWDGMPGHVLVTDMTREDTGDHRTRLISISLFHTTQDRDGMIAGGMEEGMNQSYAALDALLRRI